jgi:hypothetical protein
MFKKTFYVIFLLTLFLGVTPIKAQYSPGGKNFGFGIILGDPTGGTAKLWLNRENALAFSLGTSFFGNPRIGVDYLWHFNAFKTDIVNLYAGPGGAIGIGEGNGFWYKGRFVRTKNEVGLGGRGVFGLNVIPRRTPLEIFIELGVLIGFVPDFGSAADAAIGVRFYP